MKHGKKPTVAQSRLLEQNGLNVSEWLIVKNLKDKMFVKHRKSGEVKEVDK
ncbi:hypothetical protein [Listeria sp. ILCC792]|uniref:DUF6906 family protein n=1 Tax=Listeria sp. ILCC792 TaxID=1918331 RepID=UPI0015CFBCC5|nr:hypothetical protein [Listeria sp. ILCC792]